MAATGQSSSLQRLQGEFPHDWGLCRSSRSLCGGLTRWTRRPGRHFEEPPGVLEPLKRGGWAFSSFSAPKVPEDKHDAQTICVLLACKWLEGAKLDPSGKIVVSAVLTAERFEGLCSSVSNAIEYFRGLRTTFPDVYEAGGRG